MQVRSEGRSIRPFSGLDKLEDAVDNGLELRITNPGMEGFVVRTQEAVFVPENYFAALSFELKLSNFHEVEKELKTICERSIDEVDFYVVAKDRPGAHLQDQFVLFHGKATELKDPLFFSGALNHEARVLSNRFTGFSIEFVLVYNRHGLVNPLKPRTKGFILNQNRFDVRPTAKGDDQIQPKPLTKELKDQHGLGSNTLSYVYAKPDFLSASRFEDALDFYVDDELLLEIQQTTGPAGQLAEFALASLLIPALVASVVNRLNQEGDFTDTSSDDQRDFGQVIRLLQKKSDMETNQLFEILRDDPQVVVSKMLSNDNQLRKITATIKTMNGAGDAVSDPD